MALPNPDTCKDATRFEQALIDMQQLAFCGYTELSPQHKKELVAHCMDKEQWARATKNSRAYNASHQSAAAAAAAPSQPATVAPSASRLTAATAAFTTTQLVVAAPFVLPSMQLVPTAPTNNFFIMPRPGVNGAQPDAFKGMTFVLTGVFPEAGGGAGLNLGKDRVKAMIESFGGRVTGSVSGKTNYVLVGREPGGAKVGAAHSRGIPTPDLLGLKTVLETPGQSMLDAPKVRGFAAFPSKCISA